jgi:hypothetical protein
MQGLVAAKAGTTDKVPADLAGKLVWMTRFGKPRISHTGDGWYSNIEMHVASKGTTFTVASDFKHEHPTTALDQCIDRMLSTLSALGG